MRAPSIFSSIVVRRLFIFAASAIVLGGSTTAFADPNGVEEIEDANEPIVEVKAPANVAPIASNDARNGVVIGGHTLSNAFEHVQNDGVTPFTTHPGALSIDKPPADRSDLPIKGARSRSIVLPIGLSIGGASSNVGIFMLSTRAMASGDTNALGGAAAMWQGTF
jgi:hypothetical protein